MIGGSGGGGGSGGTSFLGSGGGGGGGAILVAASGIITITGSVIAKGGTSGGVAGSGAGGAGGGGSGGAIRITATTISGNGAISSIAGVGGTASRGSSDFAGQGANGGVGRIRLEAENFTRTAATTPAHSFGQPGALFVAGLPSLRITKVAGVNAPANPTGNADITLPATTANPVTVEFAATGVPEGNTVKLTVTPAYGAPTSVVSPALAGSTANASASVSANLPSGPSVLSASTTYTIVAALGDELSHFAQGERVERITVSTTMNGPSRITLVTVSGKEYDAPQAAFAGAMGG